MTFVHTVKILGPVICSLHGTIQGFEESPNIHLFFFFKTFWFLYIDLKFIHTVQEC